MAHGLGFCISWVAAWWLAVVLSHRIPRSASASFVLLGVLGLAVFMSAFWTLRLVFDAFYFRKQDWPERAQFEVGHALLNALFVYLCLGYGLAAAFGALRV